MSVYELLKQLTAKTNNEVLECFGPSEGSFEIANHVAALRDLMHSLEEFDSSSDS